MGSSHRRLGNSCLFAHLFLSAALAKPSARDEKGKLPALLELPAWGGEGATPLTRAGDELSCRDGYFPLQSLIFPELLHGLPSVLFCPFVLNHFISLSLSPLSVCLSFNAFVSVSSEGFIVFHCIGIH